MCVYISKYVYMIYIHHVVQPCEYILFDQQVYCVVPSSHDHSPVPDFRISLVYASIQFFAQEIKDSIKDMNSGAMAAPGAAAAAVMSA